VVVHVRKLVIKLVTENPRWGYTKIRDALRTGLGVEIGRTTVANILAEAGIEPAPEREKKRTWKRFMTSHWDTLCACDFFSVEALGITGTVRYMVSFVIEIKSRAVEIAGIAVDPGEEWTAANQRLCARATARRRPRPPATNAPGQRPARPGTDAFPQGSQPRPLPSESGPGQSRLHHLLGTTLVHLPGQTFFVVAHSPLFLRCYYLRPQRDSNHLKAIPKIPKRDAALRWIPE
jgi:hypothetical protein